MPRAETRDHQPPLDSGTRGEVRLAVITYTQAAGRECAECSCGWVGYHSRLKVLEDRIDRHLNKKHGGRGIRI